MNPRDFLQLALELSQGRGSSQFRSSISRAYYAAYNVGVELLEDMKFKVIKGAAGHGDVQKRLSNSGDQEVMRVGQQLGDLLGRRIQADYRLDREDVEKQKTAQILVEQARRMIEILDRCRCGERRDRIVEAIANWDKKVSGCAT